LLLLFPKSKCVLYESVSWNNEPKECSSEGDSEGVSNDYNDNDYTDVVVGNSNVKNRLLRLNYNITDIDNSYLLLNKTSYNDKYDDNFTGITLNGGPYFNVCIVFLELVAFITIGYTIFM